MYKRFSNVPLLILFLSMSVALTGCTLVFQKGRRSDVEKISLLKSQLTDLERAQAELENRLRSEIDNNEVNVQMLDKGLVITFISEVLFDSGKADLLANSLGKLSKVAAVLKTTVSDLNVGIEGHTDNVAIKHSGWKSNWELSTTRALSVLHYLEDQEKIKPKRLSATGYGEFQPVASNITKSGKQKNRRVEIVILPKTTKDDRSN